MSNTNTQKEHCERKKPAETANLGGSHKKKKKISRQLLKTGKVFLYQKGLFLFSLINVSVYMGKRSRSSTKTNKTVKVGTEEKGLKQFFFFFLNSLWLPSKER